MIHSKYLCLCLLSIALILSGCKITSVSHEMTGMEVPASYADTVDQVNSATANWADYFSDSTLVTLINDALTNNFDMRIAHQRVEASRSEVIYSKGLLVPSVDVSAAAGRMKLAEYSAAWAGNEGGQYANGETMKPLVPDYFVGFQSSWELDISGKLRNKKKAAVSRYLASEEGKNWVVTNLIAEMAMTYYQLLALDSELEIIRENIQLQENAVSMVIIQKNAGVATALPVQQFEARLLNLRSLEREGLQRIKETENRLNFLLGRFPQPIARDSASFNDSMAAQAHTGIPSDLLRNRPDIRQSENELMAAKADVRSARAAFFPSVNITAGLGYNAFNLSYLFSSPQSIAYSLFGNLTAPVLNRSAIKANFARANAFQLEALYNYQNRIIAAFTEVSDELSNIQNLATVYSLKAKEVEILNSSIETSIDLFKTGRATYLEVLLTQQNTLEAKLDLVDTKRRKHLARVNIYKVLGGGWK